jgi:hypothetical protein
MRSRAASWSLVSRRWRKELYGMTYPEGIAEEDFSAVYKVLKKY